MASAARRSRPSTSRAGAVPVLHREGEWSPEFGPGHAHWWENKSGKEVIVLSSDLIPPEYFDPGSEHLKHDM